jgi:hypothetical protein
MEGWHHGQRLSGQVLHEEGGVWDSRQDEIQDRMALAACSPRRGSGGDAVTQQWRMAAPMKEGWC